MKTEKLEIANNIHKRINMYKNALCCFEIENPKYEGKMESLEPKLAIEHIDDEWEDRAVTVLPDILSDDFIEILKSHIKTKIVELEKEFEEL